MDRHFGAQSFSRLIRLIINKVFRRFKLLLFRGLTYFCCFFAKLGTQDLHFATLTRVVTILKVVSLVIFLVIVFCDLEFKEVGYCICDEVSHYVLDCKIIQTKWLFWIATYALNDGVFSLVAIHIILAWGSFANLRQDDLSFPT